MKHPLLLSVLLILVTSCASQATQPMETAIVTEVPPPAAPEAVPTSTSLVEPSAISTQQNQNEDFFSKMGITLAAPVCDGLTPSQMEGPYYTPYTPERNSFIEEGVDGTSLILVGYVLDQNCQPLPNAWMDFWQTDAKGVYDNAGYLFRGHQFTDSQGRYYLETVVPGEYPGRTEHIHVKAQPENGKVLTSQLYFPDVPANQRDGIFVPSLIVQIEQRTEYLLAYFNFVVEK